MPPPNPDDQPAAVLLGFVIMLWGANWPVMKVGLQFIPPLSFAAARMVMGAIILFAVAASSYLRWPPRWASCAGPADRTGRLYWRWARYKWPPSWR